MKGFATRALGLRSSALLPSLLVYLLLFQARQHLCKSVGRHHRHFQKSLKDSVIPPWVDAFDTTPNITLKVSFDGTPVVNGRLFRKVQTRQRPHVEIQGSNVHSNDRFTLIMLNVDALNPARPVLKNIIHWIVSNIPGSTEPSQEVWETGTTVFNYLRPQSPTFPPGPYGIHRYYQLLFRQEKQNVDIQNVTSLIHFSTREFSRKYNLGYPVAGVFLTIDIDDPIN